MSDWPPCACGEPSSHRGWPAGATKDAPMRGWCCKCYVEAGNTPADWHPVCMSTYEAMKENTPWPRQ